MWKRRIVQKPKPYSIPNASWAVLIMYHDRPLDLLLLNRGIHGTLLASDFWNHRFGLDSWASLRSVRKKQSDVVVRRAFRKRLKDGSVNYRAVLSAGRIQLFLNGLELRHYTLDDLCVAVHANFVNVKLAASSPVDLKVSIRHVDPNSVYPVSISNNNSVEGHACRKQGLAMFVGGNVLKTIWTKDESVTGLLIIVPLMSLLPQSLRLTQSYIQDGSKLTFDIQLTKYTNLSPVVLFRDRFSGFYSSMLQCELIPEQHRYAFKLGSEGLQTVMHTPAWKMILPGIALTVRVWNEEMRVIAWECEWVLVTEPHRDTFEPTTILQMNTRRLYASLSLISSADHLFLASAVVRINM